ILIISIYIKKAISKFIFSISLFIFEGGGRYAVVTPESPAEIVEIVKAAGECRFGHSHARLKQTGCVF
ncbi:MAG: hypothetical protein ABF820_11995, partial [Sporolactobacillus sp.]